MKEQIETIPVNEAFDSGDECPFCYLNRLAERRTIRYVLGPGASYMEPDVRGATDRAGFCKEHYQKLYDYGNSLGNALMMQTYYAGLLEEFGEQIKSFAPPEKRPFFRKQKTQEKPSLLEWVRSKNHSCYICQRQEQNMQRYFSTFFVLIKNEEFRKKVESSKGFCMHHFEQLLEAAESQVPNGQRQWFYDTVLKLMKDNLVRMKGDIDWFVGMFDYRQAGQDWKNSRDAVSRGMQKLKGLYPADKPYKQDQ